MKRKGATRMADGDGDGSADGSAALSHELLQHENESQLLQTTASLSSSFSTSASLFANGAATAALAGDAIASNATSAARATTTAAANGTVPSPLAAPSPSAAALSAATVAAPTVKKRRTKNFKLREDMAKARGSIEVRIPALEPPKFATWDDFIRAWGEYMSATKTLYRRRSSCTTAAWNSRNRAKKYPVPDEFQYATMAYWCTHGCIQPSRGTGVRAHLHNRFTGCMARITADVVYETSSDNDVQWFIRVRNQIVQHNHKISDEIFQCYANNSSVPDELLLGPSECELEGHASPGRVIRSLDAADGETEFETSSRILAELDDHVDDDDAVYKIGPRTHTSTTAAAGTVATTREIAVEERRVQMARAELQPLLHEIRRTSPRVIHKRLQDVSEMVAHLVQKWHQDRLVEEHAQSSTRAYTGLLGSAAPGDDEHQQISSGSGYGDGPGALLVHRLDSSPPPPGASTTGDAPASSTLSERSSSDAIAIASNSTDSSAAAGVAGDDVLSSRHRSPYDLL